MSKIKKIVKKSHHLVNARLDFSITEIRLFTLMVSWISNDDEDFKVYKIPLKEFIDTFNIKNKNIYKELELTTDRLIKKVVKIPIEEWGKQKVFKTSLVSSFKYNIDGTWVVEATFHPDLKPYLLRLKNRFLMYDMKNVLNISSANSIRMYELLKSFEGIKERTFYVSELKEILGVAEKYDRYYNFKKRVVEQAQKDLMKHTDIAFTFDEIKIPWKKTVEKLRFYISANLNNKPKSSVAKQLFTIEDSQKELPKRVKEYKKYGISTEMIETELLKKHDELFLSETIKHCENYFNKSNVKNKAWYILKALEKGYFREQIKSDKQKSKQKTDNQKLVEELEFRKKAFAKHINNIAIGKFNQLTNDEQWIFKQEFEKEILKNPVFGKVYHQKWLAHPVIESQRRIFLQKKLLTDKERDIDNFDK